MITFQIVDFSEAERLGFIQAFFRFWMRRNNSRTEAELREKAAALLCGCKQHFRSSITRVKRITAIVPVDLRTYFENLVISLIDAPPEEYLEVASTIKAKFPKLHPWLDWWLLKEHASMLFESQHRMEAVIWESLPDSTNAEEAMHFSMYSQQGKDHDFLPGWIALRKIARRSIMQHAVSV